MAPIREPPLIWRGYMNAVVAAVLLVYTVNKAVGQIPCIAAPPCRCEEGLIDCSGLNLTSVPPFSVANVTSYSLLLDLSDNSITNISDNAFFNLSTANASIIRIDLRNNRLYDIGLHAFDGINTTLNELTLAINKFTVLPKSLMSLTNLQTLSVFQNLIESFETDTMVHLGFTLTDFSVGAATSNFKWPYAFRYLFQLKRLAILYSEQDTLPPDAFIGFEKILSVLQLEFTRLTEVPRAICELENLERIYFNFNRNFISSSQLLPTCTQSLSKVRAVYFVGNELTQFPSITSLFPEAKALKMTNNSKLLYIDDSAIPIHSKLTQLDISFNAFDQFPEAINRVGHQLQYLNIDNNKISTIEVNNFLNMTFLQFLRLSNNPIRHIANTAFVELSNVATLLMDGSGLSEIPKTIMDMTSLTFLSLANNPILCSCDMDWILKDWKRHEEVVIVGTCQSSSLNLIDYIYNYLPNCPDKAEFAIL